VEALDAGWGARCCSSAGSITMRWKSRKGCNEKREMAPFSHEIAGRLTRIKAGPGAR
jgi:hypothetical protein